MLTKREYKLMMALVAQDLTLEEQEMAFKYEETLCPDCGGQMVSRTGRYGTFWGCKKFPECKGTRDSLGRSKADREAEKNNEKRYFNDDIEDQKTLDRVKESYSFNKKKL